MPLDTKVDAQPSTIRIAADWLEGLAGAVDEAFGVINRARGESEHGWHGEAGDSFRDGMGKIGPKVDEVANDQRGLVGELRRYADEIDTVKRRMQQARELARSEGLTVNGDLIMEPGPEPPAPTPLPTDKPATPEQEKTHAAQAKAQAVFVKQVRAYTECAQLVQQARDKEHGTIAVLNRFLGGLIEKGPFNAADVLTGLAGGHVAQTAAMRAKALTVARSGGIEIAERLANNPYMTLQGRTRAAAIYIEKTQKAAALEAKAIGTRTAALVDRLGPKTKGLLDLSLDMGKKDASVGSGLLRGSLEVGSKLPVVGLGITAGGIGYDIGIADKDPTTSVAAGVGGYLAGAGTAAGLVAASTPVGWVVAGSAAASVGVGFVIEEWGDDIVSGVQSAGEKLSEINPKMTR